MLGSSRDIGHSCDDAPMVHTGALSVNPIVGHMCVMARDDPHLRLRIPEALKDQIAASAVANNRSMNAEIVSRLERSFDLDSTVGELEEGQSDHERRLESIESVVADICERMGWGSPRFR